MSPKAAAQLLKIAGIVSLGFALIVAGGAFNGLDGAMLFLHDLVDWPVNGEPAAYSKEAKLLAAIAGGVFAGFSMMLILIVAPAIERGDDQIRRAAIISFLTWYVIDSAGSVASGTPLNAVSNTLFLAIYLAPLLLVKRTAV